MSMNTYGLYAPAAFLVDPEASAYIILSSRRKDADVPENIEALLESGQFRDLARSGKLPDDFSDPGAAKDEMDSLNIENCYCSEFDGTATSCFSEKAQAPLDVNYEDDYLVYITCSQEPDLFHAAYRNPKELLKEFKSLFKDQGVKFPSDFDWWAHICKISGTYFC